MKKKIKKNNRYFIINIDEPYAEKIYEVLKRGQIRKKQWPEGNIDFEEWKEQTWPDYAEEKREILNYRNGM